MKQEIKSEIEEYVLREIKYLKGLDRSTEGYNDITTTTVSSIDTLVDLLQKEDVNKNNLHVDNRKIDIDEIKNNNDQEQKINELNVKTNIDKELKYDRWIKAGCEVAKVVVPIMFYSSWMKKGFEFEETGTFTSNTFRNLFGRFKPTE